MLDNMLGGSSGKQKCPNSYGKAQISHSVLPLSKMLNLRHGTVIVTNRSSYFKKVEREKLALGLFCFFAF